MIERIYVCTSKSSKLYRIFRLQTGDEEKRMIYERFENDLNQKKSEEKNMNQLEQQALIEDIPYYVNFSSIDDSSYLLEFKGKISELLSNQNFEIINFSKKLRGNGNVKNFDESEGIKFLIVQDEKSLYFLSISNNAVLKNQTILNLSVSENTTILNVPKGIQIPTGVTARFDRKSQKIFVYDVNRFEQMLTLNENRKQKSKETIKNFKNQRYKVSKDAYIVVGFEDEKVEKTLMESARSQRRLSKYSSPNNDYNIDSVKRAVSKLDDSIKVIFDDDRKEIKITPQSAKTFVGIIYNSIVERLISGEVEVTI